VALVTTEAIATGELPTCDPAQALYWGFGRVLGAEQPEFRCRMIDMPAHWDGNDQSLSRLLDLLLTETDDNQFAIRDDQYLVPRLQKRLRARAVDQPFAVDADGSVLITGGLGALGRRAAQWLADKGARQIVLVSRGEPNESTHQWIESVEQTGCQVIHEPVDLSIPEDVYQLIGRFGKDWKPLAGIIHAAGVVDDGLIDTQSWERFRNVLAAKITGVTALHEATKELPLDFFILYSSAAAVLGSPGQSSYAAANSYLDALAWQRRAKGLPAISINWGPWSEGMADDERIRKRLALQGITPLAADEAHQTIEQILAAALPQATVLDVDWRRMRMGMGGQTPAMLADLIPARQQAGKTDSALVAKLKQLADSERRSLLIKNVQETLQRILSTSEPPEIDRPLIEMGLDSLMAVEFGTELQQLLGDEFAIGPTMLFDHPTIEAISEYVLGLLAGTPEEPAAVPATPASASAENENVQREPIAVIGMSCQFPGADDTDEFWSNLIQGVDSVSEIPADRWDVDKFYSADRQPGRMYTRHGGFLKKISEFDARFFNISDVEACWIDPQHRLLLENTYHALEDAGICTSPLPDPRVGVFMGIMGQDYAFLPHLEDQNIVSAFQGAGLSHSAGVGRISYIFGFEGPSIAVDTASSSSLVAVLQAVRSLQDHHCNAAVAGGVNAILAPVNSLLMSKAGLLSADGRCKSFSAAADGFGRGEGCGVIVLKRLSDAQKDGDRVLALIRGGAIVHNGFSSGITSPSGKAQSRVIRAALEDASLAPAQIQYLEAHGTGTEFGDPLELGAAAAVYGKGRKQGHPLWVGSVKGNISHLEAAGGVSGLIKTILSIDRGVIPPQIHFDEPNPHVPWSRLPLQIVTDPTPWPEGPERLAGVTALGLVGTNAHVLVSSPPVSQQTSDDQAAMPSANASVPSPLLLMISARDPSGLRRLARSYRSFIDEHREIDLPAICYTAAVGRRHFEHRLALTVDSHEVAIDKLDAFLQDRNRSSSQVANGRGSSNGSTRHESGQLLASSGVAIGTVKETIKIGWLFTGDPASRLAAACQLYQTQPVVRELVDQLDRKLAEHSTRQSVSIPSLGQTFQTDSTGNGQPRVPPDVQLFALQCGLAKLWRSWGIEPDLALGFGVGAYTAACAAGVMDFADATLLVFERQRILSAVTENTSSDGSSSPTPATEDALAAFESLADRLDYYPPNLSLVCSQTGQQVPIHRALGGSYWTQLLTADLAVADSLRTLTDSNCDFLLQLGPDGRLGSGNERVSDFETTARQLVSIELGQDPLRTMTHILGQLYAAGINPNYREFDYAVDRRKLSLPKYPFHRQRYWITEVDQYLDSSLEQAQT